MKEPAYGCVPAKPPYVICLICELHPKPEGFNLDQQNSVTPAMLDQNDTVYTVLTNACCRAIMVTLVLSLKAMMSDFITCRAQILYCSIPISRMGNCFVLRFVSNYDRWQTAMSAMGLISYCPRMAVKLAGFRHINFFWHRALQVVSRKKNFT